MTSAGHDPIDGATARALDRLSVPPLPADFADRLVAKALGDGAVAALPPVALSRGERRGVWARGRRAIIGVAAFSLMSAAAAATGVFGDAAKNVPVIGPLIAIVAPASKLKAITPPKPKPAPLAPKLVRPPVVVEAQPIEVANPSVGEIMSPRLRRQIRGEMVAQRLVDQIERRDALGITPTPEQRAKLAERLARIPPGQRIALIKRVREIRQERQAANQQGDQPQGKTPLFDPETRRLFREEWLRAREERRQRLQQRDQNAPQVEPPLASEAIPQN
jgi:hypothetical protein